MTDWLDHDEAYDHAFASGGAEVIDPCGVAAPFGVESWTGQPDVVDRALFIEPCDGPTLDIGCGPGRLVAELTTRGFPSLGIDVSAEAVRQARGRGADALRRDVFGAIPGEGEWRWALLADGNVGIGGDPVRLLTRVREVMAPVGRLIVEVAAHGVGLTIEPRRLRIGERHSVQFDWAIVGLDAIGDLAASAGLAVEETRTIGHRHAVTLIRAT